MRHLSPATFVGDLLNDFENNLLVLYFRLVRTPAGHLKFNGKPTFQSRNDLEELKL